MILIWRWRTLRGTGRAVLARRARCAFACTACAECSSRTNCASIRAFISSRRSAFGAGRSPVGAGLPRGACGARCRVLGIKRSGFAHFAVHATDRRAWVPIEIFSYWLGRRAHGPRAKGPEFLGTGILEVGIVCGCIFDVKCDITFREIKVSWLFIDVKLGFIG